MTSATPSGAPAATATATNKSAVLAQLALPHASVAERSDELRFEAPVLLTGFRLEGGGAAVGGFGAGGAFPSSSLLSVFARDLETPSGARLACAVSKVGVEGSAMTFAVEPAVVTDRVVLRGRYGAIRGSLLGVDLASASAGAASSSWKQRRDAAVSRWKEAAAASAADEEGSDTLPSLRDVLLRSALTRAAATNEKRRSAPSSAAISAAAAAWREKRDGALPPIAETVAALERGGGGDEATAVDVGAAASAAAASAAVAWCRAPFSPDAASPSPSAEASSFASAGAALAAAAGASPPFSRALRDAGFVEAAGDLLSLFASSSSPSTSAPRPSFEALSSLLVALGAMSSVEPAATSEALLGWRRRSEEEKETTGDGAATTKPATTPLESLVVALSRRALQVTKASFAAGKAAALRAAVHSAAIDFASAARAAASKVDAASGDDAAPPFDLRAAASALSATTKAAEALARALGRTAAISSPSPSGREAELAFSLSSTSSRDCLLPLSRSPDAASVVSLASSGVWACAALAAAVPAAVAARAAAAPAAGGGGGGGALPAGTTEGELAAALARPLFRALARLLATASASPRGVAALVSADAGGSASAEALLSLASSLDGKGEGDEEKNSPSRSPFASTAAALRASLAAAAHAADLSSALRGERGEENEEGASAAARSLALLTSTELGRRAAASALLSSDGGDDSAFRAMLTLLKEEQRDQSGLSLLCAELVRVSAAEAGRGCRRVGRGSGSPPLAPRWLRASTGFVAPPTPPSSPALAEALALASAASEAASAPSPAAALLGCVSSLSNSLPPLVSPPPEAQLLPTTTAARSAALLLPAPGAAAAFARDPALSAGACARLSLIAGALSGKGGRRGAALLLCCDGSAVGAFSSSARQQPPLPPLPRPSLSGAAVLEAAVRTATGALEASNADLGGWCSTAGDAVDVCCGLVSSRATAALLCRSSASALEGALAATTARGRGRRRKEQPLVLFRGKKTLDALLRMHREISSSPEALSVGTSGAFSEDDDDESDLPGVRDDPITRDLLAARAHCVRALSHWLAGRSDEEEKGGERVPDLVAAVVSAGREPPAPSSAGDDEEGPPPPPPLSPAETYTSLVLLADLMPSEWPPPGAAASPQGSTEPSPHPPPSCVRRRAALARACEPSAQEIHSLLCSASLSGPAAARAALVRLCARASGLGGGMGVFVCGPLVDALKEAASAVSDASTSVALVGGVGAPPPAADPLPAAVGAARAALECLVPLSYRPAAKAALLDLGCAGAAARLLARLVPLLGGGGSPLSLSASAAVTMALETCAALCDPSVCLDPSVPLSPASPSDASRGAPGRDTPPRSQGASLAAVLLASLSSMGNNAHVARRVFEAVLSCDDDGKEGEEGKDRHRHGAATLAAGAAKWKGQAEGTPKEELSSTGTRALLLWAAGKLRAESGAVEKGVAEVVEGVASSLERAAERTDDAPPPAPPAVEPAPRRFAAAVSASLKAAAAPEDSSKKKEAEGEAAEDEDVLRGADFDDDDGDDESGDDDLDDGDLIPSPPPSDDPVEAAASSAFDAPTRIFWRNVAARAAGGAPPVVPLELPSAKGGGAAAPAATPLLAWDLPPAQRLEPTTAALVDGLAPRKRARGLAELAPSVSVEENKAQRRREQEQAAAAAAAASVPAPTPANGAPAPIAVIEGTATMDEDLPPGV